jgi:hypothetical protein
MAAREAPPDDGKGARCDVEVLTLQAAPPGQSAGDGADVGL